MAKKAAVKAESTVVALMSTEQLIRSMSSERDNTPQLFTRRKVQANGYEYTLLSRSRVVTMNIDSQPQEGLLIFGDQNPLGRSNYARMVYRGEKSPKDIQWLYFKNKTGAVTWLGNIVINPKDGSDAVKVLIDIRYNYANHSFDVIVPEGVQTRMPI